MLLNRYLPKVILFTIISLRFLDHSYSVNRKHRSRYDSVNNGNFETQQNNLCNSTSKSHSRLFMARTNRFVNVLARSRFNKFLYMKFINLSLSRSYKTVTFPQTRALQRCEHGHKSVFILDRTACQTCCIFT